jgi:aryl-alcohol dehydrogenase-like predicted oxidoreductase
LHNLRHASLIALIRTAFERGLTFFDSAEAYGPFAGRVFRRGAHCLA